MYKVFLNNGGGINDATDYYVSIIEKSIIKSGDRVQRVAAISDIDKDDIVICLCIYDYFFLWKNGYKKVINWYQGVTPEELNFYKLGMFTKLKRKLFLTAMEKLALNNCICNIFVSESMLNHYRNKYGYKKDNYFIMPCFNEKFHAESFFKEKYENPTFVYSGSADGWQCLDKTVALFKEIQKQIHNATLTIYSKDRTAVAEILRQYGVKADIKYVPYTQLAEDMKLFKYGFLIRDNDPVNNVATPTKMSSYLASGVIPVFSDVIGDFKNVLSNNVYTVALDEKMNGLDRLYELEAKGFNVEDIADSFKSVFDTYYNEDQYVLVLSGLLQSYKLR